MNKSELIDRVAEATCFPKTEVDEVLKTILAVITDELSKRRKITLVGFGTFECRNRKARLGVNPQNPTEKIKIPAKKAPCFSAGSELKTAVQTGKAPLLTKKKKMIVSSKKRKLAPGNKRKAAAAR